MNKTLIKIFVLLVIPFLFQCKKEEEPLIPLNIECLIKNISAYGESDGSINLTVTGGSPPYGFFWSNNKTTEDLENLKAGKYILVLSDTRNQIKTDSFDILQPEPDTLVFLFDVHYPTTNNGSNGYINFSLTGGYPPYSILWSNGATTENISNLSPDIYTVSVTDSKGQIKKDTVPLNNFIVDIDGNCYTTVKIGDQTWMQQNLRVTRDALGNAIENYVYNNDTTYLKTYGRLYSWTAMMNGVTEESCQGICPDGWHAPSDSEYKTLEKALGMSSEEADLPNTWRGEGIGTNLRIGGTSGFDALFSGRRLDDGTFSYLDDAEYLWTSSESGNKSAWRRSLFYQETGVGRFESSPKTYCFSVRCLKNEN